ncbi:MAG: biotin-dependent carboxyltransferase family protein [Clostridia bacterium]|jgi:antagonist of KipI
MEGVRIIQAGILATIQDLGRRGYQKYGMPVSGAMDSFALQVGNILVGNERGEAAIEITYPGFEAEFLTDCVFAVTGGDLGAKLDGRYISMWKSYRAQKGSRLIFTELRAGCRSYLAVNGGIDVPIVMGSKSTYLRGKIGGFEGRKLQAGDILHLASDRTGWDELVGRRMPVSCIPSYPSGCEILVILGPQHEAFTKESLEKFLGTPYRIGKESDRMGYRLEGERLEHLEGPDIISDGIALGAIQVPGHGMPIVMLADRQTTGGYTKIATVITVDIPKLAQMKPGDEISFSVISLKEAHRLLREQEALLQRLKDWPPSPASREYRMKIDGISYDICVEDWVDFK